MQSSHRPLSDRAARAFVRMIGRLPYGVKRLMAGAPVIVDGQELDVEAQLGCRLINLAIGESFETLPVEAGREQIDREAWIFGDEAPVSVVVNTTIPGPSGDIRVRVYRPSNVGHGSPALVYFHGGGWVLGNLAAGDSVSRYLANHAGVTVVSVDYRLAPEHPFPAGLGDAMAAFDHVCRHAREFDIDPNRVAVGGESAGGNLAAVVALETAARRQVDPDAPVPAFQLLFMPVTDLTTKARSYDLFSDGYFLTSAQMDWYKGHYLTDPHLAFDPRVSPLLATDLSGAAPAHVAVAGFDVLRDEGEAYAAKLHAAGVPVTLRRHTGITHGLVNATGVGNAAKRALSDAASALQQGLAAPAVFVSES